MAGATDEKDDITMGKIYAIVLAAGESKRMGYPKMLLPFGGMPMLERVVENIKNSRVDEILVVLGAYREKLEELVKKAGVSCCVNPEYERGMLSSVQCGFRYIPENAGAVLVFQGDQPLISHVVVNEVIDTYYSSGKGIVIPVYDNRRGHPLLVTGKYFNEIQKLDHGQGLRSLAENFKHDVEEVCVKEAGILRDFDTFEEYSKEVNKT